MKFNELSDMMQKPEPKPDTYEAGMALNQLLKIGTHAIKIHNMIDDGAEMEAWVAKKIDLASNYVKSVHGYTAGSKAGTYDDDGMSEMKRMPKGTGTMQGVKEGTLINSDAQRLANEIMGLLIRNKEYFEKNDNEKAYMIMQYAKKLKKFTKADDRSSRQQEESAVQEDAGDKYFDFENSDEYADNVEKYGDVDKTPLTPQERQQFAKWLTDSANDYYSMALDGVEEIGDDPSAIEDQYHKFIPKIKEFLKQSHAKGNLDQFADDVLGVEEKFGDEDLLMNDNGYAQAKDFSQHATNYTGGLEDVSGSNFTVKTIRAVLSMIDDDPHIASAMLVFQQDFEGTPLQKKVSRVQASESVSEDAGEGHMSKSQLYATAKMAIELIDMIDKGDDLEGWVQTKLNLAADYLQAVYHYEDYQKLNPYREDLDGALVQRHAGIIQKHLDEILARETKVADVDTKPGMMRILKKRVNEVEKEVAKENRKNTDEGGMPASVIKSKQKYANMSDEELADRFKGADEKTLRQMAWRHGYGNMSSHYLDRVKNVMTGKKTATTEAELEEGIKEWGKRLAIAGVIVAGLAGVNSINNAIDNSIPAVNAMNTALELAQDSGNTELAKMIEKDLSDAKVRLSSGKDLSHVADMQDKYAKFMKTEGLAYESKLMVNLKQRLK